ncbi:esterase [Curvibacter sp. HBC28]|uniref:Esterase n=1 Tax=Curvibacter microcysteis TaxID=3026419 RepID=A0ABT5M8Y4_9BURK|nr:YqiA/YcfP family alpha/beta fold hydrolase [Curvibacter sp. HBC28]MDD0813053.1 esterase [Curvibacter sp. HBC28]
MPNTPHATTHLLYLHGFRSSPQSAKARQMAEAVQTRYPHVHWWCPQLPPSPRAAVELLRQGLSLWPHESMAVVGSSLGGFYASWVARQTGCRSVLINPAVDPARDLARYIGEQTFWHQPEARFFFEPRYVDELRELALEGEDTPGPEFALIAKGDEVLDWREMTARYPQAQLTLLEGGDHAVSDFHQHLDAVLAFLQLV